MKFIYIFVLVLGLLLVSGIILWKLFKRHRQSKLRQLLRDIVEEFNDEKINYWVDYGSLLGIYRDNDIIQGDDDIDICILLDESTGNKLKNIIDRYPEYYLEYHPWKAYRIVYKGSKLHPQIYADLYVTENENGMYIDPTGKIPINLVEPRKYYMWNGVNAVVPNKIEESLEWRYGNDWKIPQDKKSVERI